jgi:delta 1-pyrroline-5-carboxylate dehydrogenase
LKIGPSEDPSNYMGAVVDPNARDSILQYIEIGKKNGKLVFQSEASENGYFVQDSGKSLSRVRERHSFTGIRISIFSPKS